MKKPIRAVDVVSGLLFAAIGATFIGTLIAIGSAGCAPIDPKCCVGVPCYVALDAGP